MPIIDQKNQNVVYENKKIQFSTNFLFLRIEMLKTNCKRLIFIGNSSKEKDLENPQNHLVNLT